MDVDNDIEGQLALQMGCMGTVDREMLVRQFQQILGEHQPLSADNCAFFLDMNNWNLQAALGSFYDYGGQNASANLSDQTRLFPDYLLHPPAMIFVSDITIGEGESVPPSTRFTKTWRVRNPGPNRWPEGSTLRHIEGTLLADTASVSVPIIDVDQEGNVSVEMTSPTQKGIYQSRWQMNTPHGMPFGETIWCIIVVDETGLLGITQQIASTSFGTSTAATTVETGGNFAATHGVMATNPFSGGSFVGSLSTGTHYTPNNSMNEDEHDDTSACAANTRTMLPDIHALPPQQQQACTSTAADNDYEIGLDQVLYSYEHSDRASPNGSSALYQAISRVVPPSVSDEHAPNQRAAGNTMMDATGSPEPPPCTPVTPPRSYYTISPSSGTLSPR